MLRTISCVLGAVAASGLFLVACGGSSDTNTSGGTTSGNGGGSSNSAATNAAATTGTNGTGSGGNVTHAEPPDPPANAKAGDGQDTVFAIKTLYLGDTDRKGVKGPDAWQDFGFDLDGNVTDCMGNACAQVRNQCKTVMGAPPNTVQDGTNGIDNSFGHNIIPLISSFNPGAAINQDIAAGKFTIMVDVGKLGSGSNYKPLTSLLYGGSDLMAAPKFDGTDMWPVIPELLNNPTDITSSKVQFPMSYVTNNTWVSGTKGDVTLDLSISGYTLELDINSAVLAFDMAPDHKSATNGTVAGVLKTSQLITQLGMVVGAASKGALCPGTPSYDQIVLQIQRASDIMSDGSAGSPNQECDGISIGLGFDAGIVQLGGIGPAAMGGGPNPCAGM